MSLHRRDPARDANEPDIVKFLRQCHVSVQQLSGKGVPDLLCGFQGRNVLLEVKGELGPKGGRAGRILTPDQLEWHEAWRGGKVYIVRNADEALSAIHREVNRLNREDDHGSDHASGGGADRTV